MSDNRSGVLTFNQKSGRFRIVYENNQFDYDEITSGQVLFVKILGIWKQIRCEYNSTKECYYGVGLELPLKEGLEASLYPQKNT